MSTYGREESEETGNGTGSNLGLVVRVYLKYNKCFVNCKCTPGARQGRSRAAEPRHRPDPLSRAEGDSSTTLIPHHLDMRTR